MVVFRSVDVVGEFDDDLFFFQAEDGIRDLVRSRGLGDVYKRQCRTCPSISMTRPSARMRGVPSPAGSAR